jgi:hypothetical protein
LPGIGIQKVFKCKPPNKTIPDKSRQHIFGEPTYRDKAKLTTKGLDATLEPQVKMITSKIQGKIDSKTSADMHDGLLLGGSAPAREIILQLLAVLVPCPLTITTRPA